MVVLGDVAMTGLVILLLPGKRLQDAYVYGCKEFSGVFGLIDLFACLVDDRCWFVLLCFLSACALSALLPLMIKRTESRGRVPFGANFQL